MPLGPTRDLGHCEIWWNSSKVGEYHDSVGVRFSGTEAEVFEASFGSTPVDCVITGQMPMEVDVPFTRLTLAALASIIPGGSNSGGESGNVAVYDNMVGSAVVADSLAKELIIKPIHANAVSSEDYWLTVPLSYPKPSFDFAYNNDGQRVYMTTFKSYPNSTSKLTWHIGAI